MDIKFNSVRVAILFTLLTLGVGTTYAGYRSRGSGRVAPRHHNRREVSNYLAPPAQDASYTSYGSPSFQPPQPIPYRPGPHVLPPQSTESPGYFSRFVSWLNPFGGSPTPPPFPDIQPPRYGPPNGPSQTYGPPSSPPSQSYGLPQPPPAGIHGYLPPKGKGRNCHPCNQIPWIPMGAGGQKDAEAGATNVEVQPSVGEEVKSPSGGSPFGFAEEIRTPDYSYRPLSQFSGGNLFSAPIPYPHLYPGPMPPLFKSQPFAPSVETFHPTPSVQLESGPFDHGIDSVFNEGGHVDVLPPGAEVDLSGDVGEIRDSPPSGYEDIHHGVTYDNQNPNVQHSTIVHEDHLSTELTAGYKVQTPSSTSVEVVQSVPTAEFTSSVDHPIHFEESPLIDLSQTHQNGAESGGKDYAAGLNPPPNVSPQSYAGSQENGGPDNSKEVKNSYGVPVGQESPRDSFVASTVTNRTFSYPTPSYGIPDVGGLPISHEATKPTVYESYPPSTEKFLISVEDPAGNSMESLKHGAQGLNGNSQAQPDNPDDGGRGRVVDSYQQHIESPSGPSRQNGQSEFINTPEPLVPYKPSTLYVPYPPYSGPHINHDNPSSSTPSGPSTEEPFLNALLNSYDNFKREMEAKDQVVREEQDRLRIASQAKINSAPSGGTTWVSQPHPSFSNPDQINPSVYTNGKMVPVRASGFETKPQQPGGKKNKQVQIIIPYTSQYTPSPFQPLGDDWSGRGSLEQTQGRKVSVLNGHEQNYLGQESSKVEVVRPLEKLLSNEIAKKPTLKQANNSIDVLKLQKNIDNWTIQEYSRGITASTALPSSSHPYLLPSKNIPNEYLNSNQSSVSDKGTDGKQRNLPGFNYNDLEHEGSASSRVDVPHVQVLTLDGASKPVQYTEKSSATVALTESTTPSSPSSSSPSSTSSVSSTSSTTTQASWAELPVSISPHNNERVYVVTPQPVRSAKSWPVIDDSKSEKFEAIERAYQVLPQAVNNLASTSVSGPEHSQLWGIMEHDQYAKGDEEKSSTSIPILYSGHSKVSNARSH